MRTRTILASFLITALFGIVIGSLLIPDHCLVPESDDCPNENITFHLYSRVINYEDYVLDINNPSTIQNAPFYPNCPLKFLVHGYTGYKDYTPNMEIRPEYMKHPDPVNMISVDYQNLVREGCYVAAVKNAPLVAKCIAQFFDTFFAIRTDISLDHLHVIGMSLGAQVSAQIKNYLQIGEIPRITGLDAAMPLFFSHIVSDDKYLSKGDAIVVDCVHTNGGEKGKLLPYADIDFYANGGRHQPQCKGNSSCSHAASAVYYAESINSRVGFWGKGRSFYTHIENDKWNLFGEYTNLTKEAYGTYWFKTNPSPPFAMGFDGGDA